MKREMLNPCFAMFAVMMLSSLQSEAGVCHNAPLHIPSLVSMPILQSGIHNVGMMIFLGGIVLIVLGLAITLWQNKKKKDGESNGDAYKKVITGNEVFADKHHSKAEKKAMIKKARDKAASVGTPSKSAKPSAMGDDSVFVGYAARAAANEVIYEEAMIDGDDYIDDGQNYVDDSVVYDNTDTSYDNTSDTSYDTDVSSDSDGDLND